MHHRKLATDYYTALTVPMFLYHMFRLSVGYQKNIRFNEKEQKIVSLLQTVNSKQMNCGWKKEE
jgi:hypothetical protein